MKITYRIPTEMDAYVEIENEFKTIVVQPDGIQEDYQRYVDAFKPKPVNELPVKEWNRCLEEYLHGKGMSAECMEKLSPKQSWMIHEIDKAFSRLKGKEN